MESTKLSVIQRSNENFVITDTISKPFPYTISQIIHIPKRDSLLLLTDTGYLLLMDLFCMVVIKSYFLGGRKQQAEVHIRKSEDNSTDLCLIMVKVVNVNGESSVLLFDLHLNRILQSNPFEKLCLVNHFSTKGIFNIIGIDPQNEKEILCYSINSANAYRMLVRFIEDGKENEAIEFAKSKNMSLDIYFKLKLEHFSATGFSEPDIGLVLDTLSKISDDQFVVEYGLNYSALSIANATALLSFLRRKLLKPESSLRPEHRKAVLVNSRRLAMFKSLKCFNGNWFIKLEFSNWLQFRNCDVVESMQNALSVRDVGSFLIMWRIESKGFIGLILATNLNGAIGLLLLSVTDSFEVDEIIAIVSEFLVVDIQLEQRY